MKLVDHLRTQQEQRVEDARIKAKEKADHEAEVRLVQDQIAVINEFEEEAIRSQMIENKWIEEEAARLKKAETKITPDAGAKQSDLTYTGQDLDSYMDGLGGSDLIYPSTDGSISSYTYQWLNESELQEADAPALFKNIITSVPPVNRSFKKYNQSRITKWKFVGITEDGQPSPQMQQYIDNMLKRMEDDGGPFDTLLKRAASFAYWSGALFGQIIIDQRTKEFIRFGLTNPFRVRFRKANDPKKGFYYQLGIYDENADNMLNFKSLEGNQTILYSVFNPSIDRPYASPYITSAVFPTIILFPAIVDMRRAIKGQAFPRRYLTTDTAILSAFDNNLDKATEFLNNQTKLIVAKQKNLKPQEQPVLPVGRQVTFDSGAMSSNVMRGLGDLRDMMIQFYSQSLGVPTNLLGDNTGATLAWSDNAWYDYYSDADSDQEVFEHFFSTLVTRAANAVGIPGYAVLSLERNNDIKEFRMAEIHQRQADVHFRQLEVAQKGRELGILSNDRLISIGEEIFDEDVAEINAIMTEESDIQQSNEDRIRLVGKKMKKLGESRQDPEPLEPPDPGPLPPIIEPEITEEVLQQAVELFEQQFSEYEGLLEANISNEEPESEESDWIYYEDEYYYYEPFEDIIIEEEEMDSISDRFITALFPVFFEISLRLADGAVGVDGWVEEMRRQVMLTNTAQYLLARGGIFNLNESDLVNLVLINLNQFEFLQNFAQQIADGLLTRASFLNRTSLYTESSTAAYERGKAANRSDLDLPEYPADGSQICRARCRCHWDIRETEEEYHAFWTLDPRADHCESCLENARRWNPFIQTKVQR